MTLDVRRGLLAKHGQRRWRIGQDERAFLLTTLLGTSATTVMLEAVRVFLSYAKFGIDQTSQVALLLISMAAFPSVALGGLLIRQFGQWRTALLSAAALGGLRLVMQFWMDPAARIVTGSMSIAVWGWLMLALLRSQRAGTAFGLTLGFGLDLAIRTAFQTVDLPWMPSLASHGVTLLLVGLLLLAAFAVRPLSVAVADPAASPVTLYAVGPGILLYLLITGSIGLVEVNGDLTFPAAAMVLGAGMTLGVTASALLVANPRGAARAIITRYPAVPLVSAIGAVALWFAWNTTSLAVPGFVASGAVSTFLFVYTLLEPRRAAERPSVGGETLWFTLGILVKVVLLAIYFRLENPAFAVAASYALLVAAALAYRPAPAVRKHHAAWIPAVPPILSSVLVLAVLWHAITWSTPEPGPPLDGVVTVMTYNIQTGFTADDHFNLEAIARTIEVAEPDIVALQEVSRGWPITTGVDEALWLSQRLDMPFVFAGHERNDLWDTAILARSPMVNVLRRTFEDDPLNRGVLAAEIAARDENLWVFAIHLGPPRNAEEVRLDEARQVLGLWDGRTPALILGDFNAEPGSPVLDLLESAGFVDLGSAYGAAEPTFKDERRIDHILATPDIEVLDVRVLDIPTSDHFPVVATIHLRG